MVGDIYTLGDYVADTDYLEVKPAAGQEVVLHNIYYENHIQVKLVVMVGAHIYAPTGAEILFHEEGSAGFLTNMYLHLDENQFLRIYNVSGGSINIAVDGVITKEP